LGSFGWQEGLVIFLIALLLFGAKRLPEVARSLGQAFREFKRSVSGLTDEETTSGQSGQSGQSKKETGPEEPG
jgi:sec-independent protein translocase protein TatA